MVLDHLRRLAGELGVDDDLRVGEVGNGVQRQRPHRPYARHHREGGGDQHQHQVAGRPADEPRDHWLASVVTGAVKPFRAACRLLSASMRKLPLTTMLVALGDAAADFHEAVASSAGLDVARFEPALAKIEQ